MKNKNKNTKRRTSTHVPGCLFLTLYVCVCAVLSALF